MSEMSVMSVSAVVGNRSYHKRLVRYFCQKTKWFAFHPENHIVYICTYKLCLFVSVEVEKCLASNNVRLDTKSSIATFTGN